MALLRVFRLHHPALPAHPSRRSNPPAPPHPRYFSHAPSHLADSEYPASPLYGIFRSDRRELDFLFIYFVRFFGSDTY